MKANKKLISLLLVAVMTISATTLTIAVSVPTVGSSMDPQSPIGGEQQGQKSPQGQGMQQGPQDQNDKVAKELEKKIRIEEKLKIVSEKQNLQEQKKRLDAELESLRLQIHSSESAGDTDLIQQLETQFNDKKLEIEDLVNKIKDTKTQLKEKEKSKYTEQQLKDSEKLAKEIKRDNKDMNVLGLDSIIANGADIMLDTPPVIQDGRTLVPARAVAEAYGAKVQWNPDRKEVTITKSNTTIVLTINSLNAVVNGNSVPLDVSAKIINNRTLVPLRFIIENLGLQVEWDGETGTIEIAPLSEKPITDGIGDGMQEPVAGEGIEDGTQESVTEEGKQEPITDSNQYTLEQAMSDNAQLSTIAFSGLAFITGSSGADTFMPPGKVADFFGFQYMRDVDTAGYGHNTQFLSRVANNVLYILNDEQKAKLIALAKEQAPLYTNFAYNRFPIMNAFRRSLEGDIPSGSTGLSLDAVSEYTGELYETDADLSYNRAVVVGEIINSFTDEQKAYLAKMEFNNFLSWPDVSEDDALKKSMTNNEFVAVMTYASELFSWYKGSLDADVYFCPERHGTYFGGFYMKDYPAMNNPDYFISTAITGDSGKEFLNILDSNQRALITGIIDEQRDALKEIAQIRTIVSTELRKIISGETVDKEKVYSLIKRYGELDGQISALYASRFSAVNKTLTDTQKIALVRLRNLDVVPQGAYRFSTPVAMPEIANTDYMFGVGNLSENAGQTTAPDDFGSTN